MLIQKGENLFTGFFVNVGKNNNFFTQLDGQSAPDKKGKGTPRIPTNAQLGTARRVHRLTFQNLLNIVGSLLHLSFEGRRKGVLGKIGAMLRHLSTLQAIKEDVKYCRIGKKLNNTQSKVLKGESGKISILLMIGTHQITGTIKDRFPPGDITEVRRNLTNPLRSQHCLHSGIHLLV